MVVLVLVLVGELMGKALYNAENKVFVHLHFGTLGCTNEVASDGGGRPSYTFFPHRSRSQGVHVVLTRELLSRQLQATSQSRTTIQQPLA